jgi:hypothetical protein
MKLLRWATRRVRVRSVILSGHRQPPNRWATWLEWESLKVCLPAILLAIVEVTVTDVPDVLWAAVLIGSLGCALLLIVSATGVAYKLLRRRTAYLKGAGYDLSVRHGLLDLRAWRQGPKGTMREFLKSRAPRSPKAD